MLTAARVSQLARERADQARWMADRYEAQLRRLKMEEMDLEAKCRAANLSRKRSTNFEAEIDGYLQSPHCWIDKETRDLALIPFPAPPERTCSDAMNGHFEISAPA